jgi:hypothetical protein
MLGFPLIDMWSVYYLQRIPPLQRRLARSRPAAGAEPSRGVTPLTGSEMSGAPTRMPPITNDAGGWTAGVAPGNSPVFYEGLPGV